MSTVARTLEPAVEPAVHRPALVVTHLVLNLQIGGLERLLVDILRYTNAERIAARVLCIGEEGDLAGDVRELGVPVDALHLPIRRQPRLAGMLASYCREHCVAIVHAHGPYPHWYAAMARVWHPSLRVVCTKHGKLWPSTWKRRLQSRIANWLSHKMVPVSHELADHLAATEGLVGEKLEVIYNGIAPQRFCVASDARRNVRPVAIMCSRLSTEKDVPTLLQAVEIVRRSRPDFELRIVGEGPERLELERLAVQLGVSDCVHFLGRRDDIPRRLAEAAMFVLSTNTEGLSIAILEAMASGLPVIATSVGGNPEIVLSGVTGFLVPRKSPEVLAERMLELVERPEKRREMGIAGIQRVCDVFSIGRTAAGYEDLYQRVCGLSKPLADLRGRSSAGGTG